MPNTLISPLASRRSPSPTHRPTAASAPVSALAPAPVAPPALPAPVTVPSGVRRDRFVDVLRVFAIALVVAQHWLMPVLSFDGTTLSTANALTTPGAWIITWISQVMPLVFFAGGAAAAMSLSSRWRRAGDMLPVNRGWLGDRLVRLAWPVLPLAAVWLPLPYLLDAVGVPDGPVRTGAALVGQLLWFLAVYVLVTVMTPALIRLHQRWRGLEIGAMAAGAVAVDVLRFGAFDGAGAAGYANLVFVWAAIYQIGVAYAAGSLHRLNGRIAVGVAAAGFAVTALAVVAGPYPASMIGMPGAPMSNMNPPSAVLLALAAGQLGLAFALRPLILRWAAYRPVARALDHLSPRLMTVYLWHSPALVVVAGVAVVGFGWSTPTPLTGAWFDMAPLWLATLGAVLAALLHLFARYEHPPAGSVRSSPAGARLRSASVLIGSGLLALTIGGFTPGIGSVAATVAIAFGIALLRSHQLTGSPGRRVIERLES